MGGRSNLGVIAVPVALTFDGLGAASEEVFLSLCDAFLSPPLSLLTVGAVVAVIFSVFGGFSGNVHGFLGGVLGDSVESASSGLEQESNLANATDFHFLTVYDPNWLQASALALLRSSSNLCPSDRPGLTCISLQCAVWSRR